MARGKRPIRGGKRVVDKRNQFKRPPKPKKGQFNLRESSYVKDRDARTAEIENRRERLEQEDNRKRKYEEESDEEDEDDPTKVLLSTFGNNLNHHQRIAIDSDSESDENINDVHQEVDEHLLDALNNDEEDVQNDNENNEDDIIVVLKEDDEEDDETAREDSGILNDPFAVHLYNDLSDDLYRVVSSDKPSVESHSLIWPSIGHLTIQIPKAQSNTDTINKKKVCVLNEQKYAEPGKIPNLISKINWNKLYVKSQIQNNISKANYDNIKDKLDTDSSALTLMQKELFSIMSNYQDLLFCERTFSNENEIRFTYCLHAVNHLLKTRTKILHHNAKLSKSPKMLSMGEIPDEYRDQGLVRPKILIIVPFRHSCLKIVQLLIDILIGEEKGGLVANKKRFIEDFGGDTISMPKKKPKPEDYEMIFKGNTDDSFKIGIAITKKTLKLYSEFYSSDIIISSVLGLKMLISDEKEEERDFDFLASIELLIIDQTEFLFMQNWDHLIHVLNHLHLQPKNSHDTDFARVRTWSVNGWAKYYRQTLIFSSVQLPEIHSIFNKQCHNYAGKVKIMNPILSGSVCQVVVQVPQLFHKFVANSYNTAIDARFEFFTTKILPQFKDNIMYHTLIYIPSYFDFVKVRNYFKKEELKFKQICEYTKDNKVARARDIFFHGGDNFLLYSERFHFFRRIRVKGIRHLIFFAPPSFPHFYNEMCNLLHESFQNSKAGSDSNMSITILYSKYDIMQLAGIVGTDRANKMIKSDKKIHMVITGE